MAKQLPNEDPLCQEIDDLVTNYEARSGKSIVSLVIVREFNIAGFLGQTNDNISFTLKVK